MNDPPDKEIRFAKLTGCGNDFIFIDNRDKAISPDLGSALARQLCRRRIGVGADGLMLVEESKSADFMWRFYNADGSVGEMCGNGARCAAVFAVHKNIAGKNMKIETLAGIVRAFVNGSGVRLRLTEPKDLVLNQTVVLENETITLSCLNTGPPHVVVRVDDVRGVDVVGLGKKLRFHPFFAPKGTNVNFVSRISDSRLFVRTYERGVEDETLACGTGSTAAALVTAVQDSLPSPLEVLTAGGGLLTIHFKQENGRFFDVDLEGEARFVYEGKLTENPWPAPMEKSMPRG